ncbi:hypothetical protein [Paenibacillus macquariensis]|uniref:Bypass of forespore C C-terminal domain-containing protein n=1 Tax=Paenibacillus macquariensis TaxID=948756 RepID=A0ABY1KDZ7_9BACL|nr:hypothetical protein [Paenibacillus macquariensis]MEC0093156.1 hypothetical protein [Paenibacillus macquariensis]OAB29921.1 hypothetical protein PMSM_23585 [Paenibacillus macquariensis subsp. macquariensis]SIR68425.1 hypothetical protein SAMN05421578_1333 [Paenibacillus macquariensis]
MKDQQKKGRVVFFITVVCFFVFFYSTTGIENYKENKKITLLVNGSEQLTREEIRKTKVNSVTYGFWDGEYRDEKGDLKTYILIKQRSQEVLLRSNSIEDIVEYMNEY